MKIEEMGSECKTIQNGKKIVKVLRRQVEVCSKEDRMGLRTAGKERVLHSMDISFFIVLEGRGVYRVLQTSANRVLWNQDSPDLPKSLIAFVQSFTGKQQRVLKAPYLLLIR